jgi:hypothetical protein
MKATLSEDTIAIFDAIASILLRCFVLAVGAMLFIWAVWLVLGDVVYSIHSQLYEIGRKEFDLYFVYTLTGLKAMNVLFFGVPFVAIKWFLQGKRRAG